MFVVCVSLFRCALLDIDICSIKYQQSKRCIYLLKKKEQHHGLFNQAKPDERTLPSNKFH